MSKVAITNALVFDGKSLQENIIVTIENGLVSDISPATDLHDATIIDGTGQTLLPGLIDAHVHLNPDVENTRGLLLQLARAGVTTALDMGFFPSSTRESVRNVDGIADLRFAGNFSTSTGSMHSKFAMANSSSIVDTVEMAAQFVQDRIVEGADYIKIVADIPGPSQEIVNALVNEARKAGKLSIAHAARKASFTMAQEAGVDIITHSPLDSPLDQAAARLMKDQGRICVPTLVMEQSIATKKMMPGLNYAAARESVSKLHQAGVPILAGTDSNQSAASPVKHGQAMHQELYLLTEAGLSNEEALRAATSLPAKWFQMADRGVIAVGKRADLVLVKGNPVENIRSIGQIRKVWVAGKEVSLEA